MKCSRIGEVGIGVYMPEGTTSRVMAAGRPYGEFYDIYIVSPEYFGYIVVWPFLLGAYELTHFCT
jgi:hypothetical protein